MSTYRDLNLTFQKHPGSGDCLKLQDVDAVKASIKNIIFSGPYDSPFDPNYGASLRNLLFEMMSPSTFAVAKRQIMLAITEYEPRVVLEDLYIGEGSDNYSLNVGILFYVVGNPDIQKLNYSLERTR